MESANLDIPHSGCPVCNGSMVKTGLSVYDDRYGYPRQFALMRDPNYYHAFLDCDLSPSQLTALFTDNYPRKTIDIAQCKPHAETSGPGVMQTC